MKNIIAFLIAALMSFPAFALVVPTVIASGTSTSPAVNLNNSYPSLLHPAQIQMPAAWTTSSLIFLVSNDNGTTFTELYDGNGNEYVVNAEASALILLDPQVFNYVSVFKIESCNYGSPPCVAVNQGSARTLNVIALPATPK